MTRTARSTRRLRGEHFLLRVLKDSGASAASVSDFFTGSTASSRAPTRPQNSDGLVAGGSSGRRWVSRAGTAVGEAVSGAAAPDRLRDAPGYSATRGFRALKPSPARRPQKRRLLRNDGLLRSTATGSDAGCGGPLAVRKHRRPRQQRPRRAVSRPQSAPPSARRPASATARPTPGPARRQGADAVVELGFTRARQYIPPVTADPSGVATKLSPSSRRSGAHPGDGARTRGRPRCGRRAASR